MSASSDNRKPSSTTTTLRSTALRIVRFVLLLYLGLMLMLLWLENSLIFPAPQYPVGDWRPRFLQYEDIFFQSADGTPLHGWYVQHPQPRAYLLFCHGNGENVADQAGMLHQFVRDYEISIFAFDYRGYGRSEGNPHEEGVLADGHAAHSWLAQRAAIPIHKIVLMGRSLGGAIATELAAVNGARGLVLERTFTSMPDVASRLYPFMPVRMLMKTQFNSLDKIGEYEGPLLQSHGSHDQLVPIQLGRQLFEAAGSREKQFLVDEGGGHNDGYTREYLQVLGQFLDRLPDEPGTSDAKAASEEQGRDQVAG